MEQSCSHPVVSFAFRNAGPAMSSRKQGREHRPFCWFLYCRLSSILVWYMSLFSTFRTSGICHVKLKTRSRKPVAVVVEKAPLVNLNLFRSFFAIVIVPNLLDISTVHCPAETRQHHFRSIRCKVPARLQGRFESYEEI